MNLKKFIALTLGATLCVGLLAGCGGQTADTAADTDTADGADKPVILVVSFGTSYNDSREATIGAIETAIADAYPDYEVRRAFTSQTIIDKLKERDGLEIDNMEEALERLIADGVKNVVVQPTHVMGGYEYDDVAAAVESYQDQFDQIVLGDPLLTSDEDYTNVANALLEETADVNQDGTAIVFMGHGTEHEANSAYAQMQETFTGLGASNYLVGTVEATPDLEDVMALLADGNYTKVVLEPLMVVAGDHANNDMAGDEDDSWKTLLQNAGYEVEPILKGMGEISAIQDIYVQHVQNALDSLN